ncbi:MAG: calcium-translocating P-type ATPase, SERCA-type [Nanoarchaeota archaeon]
MFDYYTADIGEAINSLKTSVNGLSEKEAENRLRAYGLNKIEKRKEASKLTIFLMQFKSFLVFILIIAVIISLLVKEYLDAGVIGAILILNAFLGFFQEYRVERAIEALRKLTPTKARVVRDSKIKEINAEQLVPGDVIVIESGDNIPADARLIEVSALETDESSLTGESVTVKKEIKKLPKAEVSDRTNMIFSGTTATYGRARAVVTDTGMNTELGKIANLIKKKKETTPLQKKLDQTGKWMGLLVIIIALIIFLIGLYEDQPLFEMLLVAIALAVAAVPEGLPAVVTITLALGAQRMVKRNALIRKLSSVETLGSVNVICTDKTGTLTVNEMTVKEIYTDNRKIIATGEGYNTLGEFFDGGKKIGPEEIKLILEIAANCNNAILTVGDPTERALAAVAGKGGIKAGLKRIGEIPFDPDKKYMVTIHEKDGKKINYIKGAPEVVLKFCNYIYVNNRRIKLTPRLRRAILKENEFMANKALRVLGFAYSNDKLENSIFVGLMGMIDPPRKEVKDSIKLCEKAGIRVVMITGDHKLTAEAIAKDLGIKGQCIIGKELDELSDVQLIKDVDGINIYARVNPGHKVRILKALKARGCIVAMTGDGVNDAPALKKSDIGVAMGVTGTDVAKEASDMVLVDDNFTSIVNAVEEGRMIYDNIRKFVWYLLSSNVGEVLLIFMAMLIGMPLPLLALQILWINLITDGLPALALSIDPESDKVMERKPRNPKEKILSRMSLNIFIVGILMALGSLFLFNNYGIGKGRTVVFSALVMFEIFNVLNARSEKESIFKIGLFSNKYLILAIVGSILLQLAVIYTPLSALFDTVRLGLTDWVYIVLVSSSVLIAIEIKKLISRHYSKQ